MTNTLEDLRCPACFSIIRDPVWEIANLPVSTFPTSIPHAHAPMHLLHCVICGHYSQPAPDPNLQQYIYSEAYGESPLQPGDYIEESYAKPFLELFSTIPLQGCELLEIGCGDPRHLLPFAEKGFSCLGVDPSPIADVSSPHPRISIIQGYVEQVDFSANFDLILMRFCLEHIVNIDTLISRCQTLLQPDGLLFVQVPNNEYCMLHRPPLFAAHEHIHYFTRQSLDILLMRHGFTPVGSNPDNEPSLIGVYKKGSDRKRQHLEFLSVGNRIEHTIRDFLNANPNPIFYGWGMTFMWILSKFDLSDYSSMVVDDAPQFYGKPIPGTDLLVTNLATLEAGAYSGQPFLLCLSSIYHTAVKARIRQRFPEARIFGVMPEGVCPLD